MEPNIWGPAGWKFLHSITFNYPLTPDYNDKQNYKNFFENLQYVLPCPNCQNHYSQNIIKFPIRLESRNELVEWLIDIHNEVNKKNNKKVYSYQEVYQNYNQLYNQNKNQYLYHILILLILIIIVIYYNPHIQKKISSFFK